MASTYSDLKFELIGTGEQSGVWGTTTNDNIGTAIEQALVGLGNPIFTTDANLTISLTNTVALQTARALVLNATSSGSLTATRELVVPTIEKQYIVQNNTTGGQSITVKTTAGTGITVTNGRKAHLYVDGVNVIQMFDFVDINGGAIDGTPIGASSASTGAFTTLAASGAVTLSGGTANGVAYLNGSKVLTSGSALTFDGTNLVLGGAQRINGTSTSGLTLTSNSGSTSGFKLYNDSSTDIAYLMNFYNGSMVFGINNAEQMRLTSTGLGIGNTAIGSFASETETRLAVGTGSGNTGVTLYTGNTSYGQILWADGTSGAATYAGILRYDHNINAMQFYTNGLNERMRLDSSGNLGLGVTPSAWTTPAIQAGSYASVHTNSNLGAAEFLSNAYRSAATTYNYINTNYATRYRQYDGAHTWWTAASGTAGNAITFTQAMTLDASGRLLLGTTTATGTVTVSSGEASVALTATNASGRLWNLYSGGGGNVGAGVFAIAEGGATQRFVIIGGGTGESARIDSSGNLLVGATSGTTNILQNNRSGDQTLYIQNTNASDPFGLYINYTSAAPNSTGSWFISCRDSGTNRMQVYSNGNLVNTNNSYGAISDAKLKENVTDATPKLEKLNQVRIVNFNMKGDEQKQLGVIAQELEQVFPGMVEESPDRDEKGNDLGTTTKSVKYSVFVPMLIKAMQEQQAIITALTARVAALESN